MEPEATGTTTTTTTTTTTWDSDKNWERRLRVLSHVITSPATSPPLSSQLLVSSLPFRGWAHHPPATGPVAAHWAWGLGLFLRRASRLGAPATSWRARCPYTHPPPPVLAVGLGPAQWAEEERKAYAKRRLRIRRRLAPIPLSVTLYLPTVAFLYIIFRDPLGDDRF